jgi:two-component system phosphate regulon sensor histidine kinase PhoR
VSDIKSNQAHKKNPIQGMMTITWIMLSFLLIPWLLFMIDYLPLLSAFLLTLLIVVLIIPLFLIVNQFRNTVSYHTETLRLIYSRFQESSNVVIPVELEKRRIWILKHIDDILHHLNTTILDIEDYRMRLRVILDALPIGIIVLNDDDDISYINERAKSIFHLEDTFIHKKLESINIPLQLIAYVKAFKKGDMFNKEYDFESRTYQMRMNSIVFKKNQVKPYILIALDDISLEKSTERIKKDFFSYASHELKSPLTSIKGYAELMQLNMLEDGEYNQALESIVKQTDLMNRLVEDMLMLARLEHFEIEKQTLTVAEDVLKEVLKSFEPLSIQKNIRIHTDMNTFNCMVDPLDLHKLFKNLIENALKYSEANKEIFIKLYQESEMMIFNIVDQGSGIKEQHQSRIFERFYRIEKDRVTIGTGLGLAIVKHIVLKYHGQISLNSQYEKGTTFNIKLPIKNTK